MMNLLTKQEIRMMEAKLYGATVDEMNDFNSREGARILLVDWANAKEKRLKSIFGNDLIKSKKVVIEKALEELAEDLRIKGDEFFKLIMKKLKDAELVDSSSYWRVLGLISYPSELITNKMTVGYTFEVKGKKPFKVNKGQKAMKALHKICEVLDVPEEDFEEFRLLHSQVLNNKKVEGELCLSIHPLDYLTMSDNANGWDSCMSLDNEGCYRAGVIETMNCPNTIVAYLKSDSIEYEIQDIENRDKYYWNSKKFRQLVIINEQGILTNRAYPYRHDELTQEVINFAAELCGEDYEGENIFYNDYEGGSIKNIIDFKLETYEHMYNDFAQTSFSFIRLNKNLQGLADQIIRFELGGRSKCCGCGTALDRNESILCSCCSEQEVCAYCCEIIEATEERYTTTNGDILCEYCYDNHTVCCASCCETCYTDDTTFIDEDDNMYAGNPEVGYYCEECEMSLEKNKECC